MGYNRTMKKEPETFEFKIRKSFLKYARIPFLILFVLVLLLFISNEYLVPAVSSHRTIQTVKKEITKLEGSVLSFGEQFVDVETNSDFYRLYYQLILRTGLEVDIAVYNSDYKTLFMSNTNLEGSALKKSFNSAFLDRMEVAGNLYNTSFTDYGRYDKASYLYYGLSAVDGTGEVVKIIFAIESSTINESLRHSDMPHVVITNSRDYIITSSSSSFIQPLNRFNTDQSKTVVINDLVYQVRSKVMPSNDFRVSVLYPKQTGFTQSVWLLVFIFFAFIFQREINKKVSKKLGKEATASINQLLSAIETIKTGNLGTRVMIQSNDEFENLGYEFNVMSEQLNHLMIRNEKLIELKKNAEIKQLEAQFNPHFLYNSLETIRYLIDSDPLRAQSLILNITQLLRYSIAGSESLVLFKDDLNYIELYLQIQKIRLGQRFTYIIDTEEACLLVKLPKLLLQPLIENSIKHGFFMQDRLHVSIKGRIHNGRVVLEVSDNGSGMSQSSLERFNTFKNKEKPSTEQYGLISIYQRLKLIYEDEGSMRIESSEEGTVITIEIPMEDVL